MNGVILSLILLLNTSFALRAEQVHSETLPAVTSTMVLPHESAAGSEATLPLNEPRSTAENQTNEQHVTAETLQDAAEIPHGTTNTRTESRRPLAIVRRFNPLVLIRHGDNNEWIDARTTHPLHNADTLRTGEEGFAVVQFMDNSVARVRPNSLLIITGEARAPDNTSSRISVEVGDLFLNIRGGHSQYEVATPSAVAAVRGTEFSTSVSSTGETEFTGFSGEVVVTALGSGETYALGSGFRASVDALGQQIIASEINEEEMQRQYSVYTEMDEDLDIKTIRLQFINEAGEVEIIELEYIEVSPDER